MSYRIFFRNCVTLVILTLSSLSFSQIDESLLFRPLQWRCIGPKRGGRSIAVAGHKDRPFEYYFGATGGGLWKTTDGGTTWHPVTDGQIRSSSVGAVAVAESNPDIVYIGMGESQLRQNVLQGDGIYKSTDGGQTWKHIGLEESQVISRVRIHPSDPNRVYVAALGHPFGPNPERGVFRTLDGGRTWKKILFKDERTGAIDLVLTPRDPDVLYATLWEVYRRPWILWSGGEGSGIFKSTDGGETWKELTKNQGFPKGILGKITVTLSAADSKRVYANIEAEKGGLYRSDDAGDTWTLINNQRDLWQRAFYFLRIQADPVDRETIYVLNFRLLKSTDGGRSFVSLADTHSDHHDLWIDPNNPLRMINANDGGGVVSVNGGKTWTHMRYPTGQIYRLATTKDIPYHACGAQQDNSTVCVPSDGGHLRNPRGPSGEWMYAVGGGESGYIAPHLTNADIFYAGATNTLTRYDRKTGLSRDIQPYPRIVMGEPAKDMPERWNWTYPIVISPIDHSVLYIGSQHLWRTTDEGKTWTKISPDLTMADPETLGDSGGPIVKDQDGPEIYATVYTIAPSYHDVETIWTGSDDGLVCLTRDGGKNWKDVTPPDMPKHSRIGLIEASPHDPRTVYVAARRYEMDDRAPYLWETQNYGESWTKIVNGFQKDDFVYVVREDPERKGLLYAGTEHGVYISIDDGHSWQILSLNLPDVPVTGLVVEERDLVIATHGRSFWVLDDIETLRQIDSNVQDAEFHLFKPADAIRRFVPAVVDCYVKEPGRKVLIEILDAEGQHVRTLFEGTIESEGVHRHSWDLRYPGAVVFPGIILEGGNPKRGPWAPPGRYQTRLVVDGNEQKREFNVKKDPRLTDVTDGDLKAQFDLALKIRDKESAANKGVILIRNLKAQVENRLSKTGDRRLRKAAIKFVGCISTVEKELYQVKNQSPKDKIAFPIKLNDRLTGLRSHLEQGDAAPTKGYHQVFEELSAELTIQLQALKRLLREYLPRLNKELERLGLDRLVA
ncbi:MAG: glycosyl hydrolase [Candidatus Aminicenantes bacterium]|nr:glycosyl hydrolase [Candidatus Aminicenantes bacterium]